MIVAFVKRYFFDEKMGSYFQPKMPFKPLFDKIDIDKILDSFADNKFRNLEKFLNTISPDHIKVPVLLKQYTKLNAKFLSFNIDPNFSFALDGLMLLNIKDLPQNIIDLLNDK